MKNASTNLTAVGYTSDATGDGERIKGNGGEHQNLFGWWAHSEDQTLGPHFVHFEQVACETSSASPLLLVHFTGQLYLP